MKWPLYCPQLSSPPARWWKSRRSRQRRTTTHVSCLDLGGTGDQIDAVLSAGQAVSISRCASGRAGQTQRRTGAGWGSLRRAGRRHLQPRGCGDRRHVGAGVSQRSWWGGGSCSQPAGHAGVTGRDCPSADPFLRPFLSVLNDDGGWAEYTLRHPQALVYWIGVQAIRSVLAKACGRSCPGGR